MAAGRAVVLGGPRSGGGQVRIAIGFDGSTYDDWTCIRAETIDGWQFTPTYGPDDRPTIWNPAEFGGEIPRSEVHAAVDEIFTRHEVARMYCDRREWSSEIDAWALRYGDQIVAVWETYRVKQMHEALIRFTTDLQTGALTHDGCPTTALHVANARKYARPGERYILAKPAGASHQKIDAAVTSVIAHEAACDARAAGWAETTDTSIIVFR